MFSILFSKALDLSKRRACGARFVRWVVPNGTPFIAAAGRGAV